MVLIVNIMGQLARGGVEITYNQESTRTNLLLMPNLYYEEYTALSLTLPAMFIRSLISHRRISYMRSASNSSERSSATSTLRHHSGLPS